MGPQRILGQIKGESIGIIKAKGHIPGQLTPFGQILDRVIQEPEPPRQSFLEPDFFMFQRFGDQGFRPNDFRKGLTHFRDQSGHQLMHQGFFTTKQMSMAHSAAHYPAQDIAPALIGRQDPIGNQKTGSPQMIGNHPVGNIIITVSFNPTKLGRGLNQILKQINLIIVMGAMQHRHHPFQTHAGIDTGLRQIQASTIGLLIILHEYQIPNFNKPVTIFFRTSGRSAGDMIAVVIKDLGTRSARPGVAHGPEIIRSGNPDDTIFRQVCYFPPQIKGLIIVMIDRHH